MGHVPGLGLSLFSLHVVRKQQAVVIDPVGVHVTPRRLVFPSTDVGSQLPAARKVRAHQEQSGPAPVQSRAVGLRPVAAATVAPANIPVQTLTICKRAHPGILHETARQLGFRLTGKIRACDGCSIS